MKVYKQAEEVQIRQLKEKKSDTKEVSQKRKNENSEAGNIRKQKRLPSKKNDVQTVRTPRTRSQTEVEAKKTSVFKEKEAEEKKKKKEI